MEFSELFWFLISVVFNQKSFYNGYKKRTKNIKVNPDEYAKAREADPEFYRDGASLRYGKVLNSFMYNWSGVLV
jgi:hypothetical protein